MRTITLRNTPRDILVLRMSGVGDVLWTTPFLANLRRGFPKAHIAYVVKDACSPVLENNPDVDELLIFRKGTLRQGLAFLRGLKARCFDLAIDLVGTPRTALQCLASGAPDRIGFDFGYRRHFYNQVLNSADANYGHEVQFNLHVLACLSLPVTTTDLVFNLSTDEQQFRDQFFIQLGWDRSKPTLGLIPTGGWACKRWPAQSFAEVSRHYLGRHCNVLIFWGGTAERAEAERIAAMSGGDARLIPQTSLRQMAALLSACDLVIGNDSGPLHIATAFGIPVVSFYGPTNPANQGPWGSGHRVLRDESLACLGCNRMDCREPRCMDGIPPERAIAASAEILDAR